MAGTQQFDISTLPLEQLSMLKQQFDQEVEHLTSAYDNLQTAISRFEQTLLALRAIPADSKDKQILLPLTGSLYATAKLTRPDKVLVDVGTGYFIEKDRTEAIKYVTGKLDMLATKEAETHITLMRKKESQETVTGLMQRRVAERAAAVKPTA